MAKGETAKSRRKVRGQITAVKGETTKSRRKVCDKITVVKDKTWKSRRKEKKFENILQKCV